MYIPPDIFEHLPFQQSLKRRRSESFSSLKKLLQQHMSNAAGKVIMLKDISNIQTSLHKKSDRNDLDSLVSKLKRVDGELHACTYGHISGLSLT